MILKNIVNVKSAKVKVFEKDLSKRLKPFLISKIYTPKSGNKFGAYFLFSFNSVLLFPLHLIRSLFLYPLRELGFANGYEKASWEPIPTFKRYFKVISIREYLSSAQLRKIYFLKVDFTSNVKGEDKNGSLYCNDFNTYGLKKLHIVNLKKNKVVLNTILSVNAHDVNDFDDEYEIIDSVLESVSDLPSSKMTELTDWKSSYSELAIEIENKFGLDVMNINLLELPVWICEIAARDATESASRAITIDASNGRVIDFTDNFKF